MIEFNIGVYFGHFDSLGQVLKKAFNLVPFDSFFDFVTPFLIKIFERIISLNFLPRYYHWLYVFCLSSGL